MVSKLVTYIDTGILGEKVSRMVLSILNNKDIYIIIDTFIALVPKVKNPSLVKDLRPIILCDVIYKLVFKVIINKLRGWIATIIHNN